MSKTNITGARIRQARKAKGLTQAQLSAKLEVMNINVDRSMINKVECGKRSVSDYELYGIAKILDVAISWLFEDAGTNFSD